MSVEAVSYVVGGLDWRGTSSALADIWRASAPPAVKLLLIRYADCPGTVDEVAEWAGITTVEAADITERLTLCRSCNSRKGVKVE